MPAAIQLAFSLPHSHSILARVSRLLREAGLAPSPTARRENWLCHDTADESLQREGLWLGRRRDGRRWRQGFSLDQGSGAQRWEQTVATPEWNFLGLPDPLLRRHLEQLQAAGALQPRYRLSRQQSLWTCGPVSLQLDLWQAEVEAVSETVSETGSETEAAAAAKAGRGSGSGALLHLAAPAAAATQLAAVLEALHARLPLLPAWQDEASAVATWALRQPPRPRKAGASPLRAGLPPLLALLGIVRHCLAQVEANRQGALALDAPEFIHQMRVGLRRLRSALACFAPLLPDSLRQAYAEPLRQLTNRVGALRDWDVQIEDMLLPALAALGESSAQQQLLTRMRREALRVRQEVRTALTDPAWPRLACQLQLDLLRLPPEAGGELGEFADAVQLRLLARLQKRARRAAGLDSEALHALRIAGKRLRYALEFLAPLYAADKLAPRLEELEALQGGLGRLNDLATLERLLYPLTAEAPALREALAEVEAWHKAALAPELARLPAVLKQIKRLQPPRRRSGGRD